MSEPYMVYAIMVNGQHLFVCETETGDKTYYRNLPDDIALSMLNASRVQTFRDAEGDITPSLLPDVPTIRWVDECHISRAVSAALRDSDQEEDYSDIDGTTINEIIAKWKGKKDE